MAGACASAMATSAQTLTRTISAMAPKNFRRRMGMGSWQGEADGVLGCDVLNRFVACASPWRDCETQTTPIWSARSRQANQTMAARSTGVLLAEAHRRAIRLWLFAVAALVFAMVLVGGATRLTESGLSITEWKPVVGVLPPLGAAEWQAQFDKYKAIPQYQSLNSGMDLAAFKSIF